MFERFVLGEHEALGSDVSVASSRFRRRAGRRGAQGTGEGGDAGGSTSLGISARDSYAAQTPQLRLRLSFAYAKPTHRSA